MQFHRIGDRGNDSDRLAFLPNDDRLTFTSTSDRNVYTVIYRQVAIPAHNSLKQMKQILGGRSWTCVTDVGTVVQKVL